MYIHVLTHMNTHRGKKKSSMALLLFSVRQCLRFIFVLPSILAKITNMVTSANPHTSFLTCFWLHREIRLPLKYAVNDSGAVPVWRVVSICSRDLHHRSTWSIQTQLSSAQYQKEEQKCWFSLKTWVIWGFKNDHFKKLNSWMIDTDKGIWCCKWILSST